MNFDKPIKEEGHKKEQVVKGSGEQDEPKPELRFAEIYKSVEWHSLQPIDRAQLLLVAEGVKPGTIIEGDFSNFDKIVKKMGLEVSLNSDPLLLEPVYDVAYPEQMKKYYKELVSLSESASNWEFHRINGRFLGYPECCTEEYIRAGKEETKQAEQGVKEESMPRVDRQVEELASQGKEYPAELDYCPPTFTPCRADCPEALKILKQWGRILETADPQAAKELREFNQMGKPYSLMHQDEIERRIAVEIDRERLVEIRKSIKK